MSSRVAAWASPLLPPAVAGGDQGEMGIQLGVGVGAGVEQLGKYLGAIGMHPFRQCPERGNFILPGRVQLPGEQDPRASSTQTISVMMSPTPPLARAS